MDKKKIGQRIRLARIFSEQRTSHKMTQEILAEKVGVTRGTIGDIEIGRSLPSLELADKITKACGGFLHYATNKKSPVN